MTTEKKVKDKRMGKLWEPAEASPEEIGRACMEGPPKERWDYLAKAQPDAAVMRVVHCYGQTPEMQAAIELYYEQRESETQREKPEYDRYEEGRDWQPTVCGLRASAADTLRPSDFVAVVNHTDPSVDMDSLNGTGFEALPYQDGKFIPDVQSCSSCKEAAPKSWAFLFYASDEEAQTV